MQSHTSETCLDNENHEEQENTNQIENPDQLNASVKEESSHAVQEEEDDGNVEVNLDDSQTDEWCLDKEVELDSEVNEREEKEEEKEEEGVRRAIARLPQSWTLRQPLRTFSPRLLAVNPTTPGQLQDDNCQSKFLVYYKAPVPTHCPP